MKIVAKLARRAAFRALPIAAFSLFLLSVDKNEAEATPAPSAPPAAFAVCAACHSVVPGQKKFGPNLAGVSGRRAGTQAGFAYSPALKDSGLTWNEAALDKWIANPKAMVAGNRMPFAGVQDPVKRKQIVDYLVTLR